MRTVNRERRASKAALLPSICLPNPDLGLFQTHTPAPFPEFPGQIRRILPRQFFQPRNLQCLERQSISNPHSLVLTQGNDLPHSLIKLRIYFRRPFFQSEELISLGGISLPQRVYSSLPEFPPKAKVHWCCDRRHGVPGSGSHANKHGNRHQHGACGHTPGRQAVALPVFGHRKLPMAAAAQQTEEVDQRITLQRKWREAKKTKDRHSAKFEFIEERHGINPLGSRANIPRFPKPAANQSCHQQRDQPGVVACRQLSQKTPPDLALLCSPPAVTDGFGQKKSKTPRQAETMLRENQQQHQHQSPNPPLNASVPLPYGER